MLAPRTETARDQAENAFTLILRRLFHAVPSLLSAVFVDVEGECIDYVAAIDPFEAKVCGAHMHMLMGAMRTARLAASAGDAYALELVTSQREVWVRRIGDDYMLVVLLAHGFDRAELSDAMACACREFRAEVGIPPPGWEERLERLSVLLRGSAGWQYAPEGFTLDGERYTISDVLGRWVEPVHGANTQLVCFRVRTQQGQELTLAHDERTEVWLVRRD